MADKVLKTYKNSKGEVIGKLLQRPNGSRRQVLICSEPTKTEQSHKDKCDINKIIERFDRDGILTHVNAMDGIPDNILNLTGADFKTAMDTYLNANQAFQKLDIKVRNRFENNPEKLLNFVNNINQDNYQEAKSLGLTGVIEAFEPKPAPVEPVTPSPSPTE